MTEEGKNFVDGLSIHDLQVLDSILKDPDQELVHYVSKLLSDLSCDALELSKELSKSIPMSYVPILSIRIINDTYYFKSVYDYCQMNALQKVKPQFGPTRIARLDCATDFLLECLENRVRKHRLSLRSAPTGVEVLDFQLKEKTDLVLSQVDDIYNFLLENGEEYIFVAKKNSLSASRLLSSSNQRRMIKILARFSELEDLQEHRIESFQKFIKR